MGCGDFYSYSFSNTKRRWPETEAGRQGGRESGRRKRLWQRRDSFRELWSANAHGGRWRGERGSGVPLLATARTANISSALLIGTACPCARARSLRPRRRFAGTSVRACRHTEGRHERRLDECFAEVHRTAVIGPCWESRKLEAGRPERPFGRAQDKPPLQNHRRRAIKVDGFGDAKHVRRAQHAVPLRRRHEGGDFGGGGGGVHEGEGAALFHFVACGEQRAEDGAGDGSAEGDAARAGGF